MSNRAKMPVLTLFPGRFHAILEKRDRPERHVPARNAGPAEAATRNTGPTPPGSEIGVQSPVDSTVVLGLPLARLDYAGTLDAVDRLIRRGEPSLFVTANLHYARLTARDPRLAAVNRQAAFLVADGMPLVWASRLGSPRSRSGSPAPT